jgi:hypothetical protein
VSFDSRGEAISADGVLTLEERLFQQMEAGTTPKKKSR